MNNVGSIGHSNLSFPTNKQSVEVNPEEVKLPEAEETTENEVIPVEASASDITAIYNVPFVLRLHGTHLTNK